MEAQAEQSFSHSNYTSRCLRTASSQAQQSPILCISLHDDILCCCSGDAQIQVWRRSDATDVSTFHAGSDSVKALLMVGHNLFSAHEDGKIKVWRFSKTNHIQHRHIASLPTIKNSIVRRFLKQKKSTSSNSHHSDIVCALAHGSQVIYSGSRDKTVKVWKLSNLKFLESINIHEPVSALAADPHGDFLYVLSAGTTVVTVLKNQPSSKYLSQHFLVQVLHQNSPINAIVASPMAPLLYTGTTDSCIRVWERRKDSLMSLGETLMGHEEEILCLATTEDLLCSGSADKTTRIWRRSAVDESHYCIAILRGQGGPVNCIGIAMDGLGGCIIYAGDDQIKVWRASSSCTNISISEESRDKERSTLDMVHWKRDAIKYALDEGSFHLVLQTLQCN